jgi:Rrf2 family protein
VLRELTRARLVSSSPPPTGGYALARPADEITVREIVEALEGPIAVTDCVLHGGPCHWRDVCPMHQVWSGALQAMTDQLARGSQASLAADDRALLEGRFKIPDDVCHRRARDGRP